MKSFDVKGYTVEAFAEKVAENLQNRTLGQIASFHLNGDNLKVVFSKLGTSEVAYRITRRPDGFRADPVSEKIAFTHKAFRGEIEGRIERMMEKLGAKLS